MDSNRKHDTDSADAAKAGLELNRETVQDLDAPEAEGVQPKGGALPRTFLLCVSEFCQTITRA